jgi:hypothetical protein
VCIRVYSTRRTSVCAKDNDSLAPTTKWGLPFILEWSELYEPLLGAGWLQETSGRPVKLRVVRLATWGWLQLQRYNPLFTSDRLDPATCLLHSGGGVHNVWFRSSCGFWAGERQAGRVDGGHSSSSVAQVNCVLAAPWRYDDVTAVLDSAIIG